MQYTEIIACPTRSPHGSPSTRYSESRNSALSSSGNSSTQQQSFCWEPFVGSVVTPKHLEKESGSCSQTVTVAYPTLVRREFVKITMQRSFVFDKEKCTWKWFKTWRLPEIRVLVNEQESFSPSFVRLSVVYPTQNFQLFEEVGLLGTTQVQVVNGESKFTRLRFIATSSSYEGTNFHLFISFFSQTACCLGALISTGFVVYSRGPNTVSFQDGVRFSQSMKAQSLWFSPELLTRPFMKKVRNEEGIVGNETIENNALGLVRYFQAPNIRFKCRDPVFLAMRFSNALVLFLNSSCLPSENRDSYSELLLRLAEYRCNLRSSMLGFNHFTLSPSISYPLCLYGIRSNVELSENERTILCDNLENFQDEAIRFLRDISVVPKHFVEVTDVLQFREAYERFFSWYTNVFLVSNQLDGNNSVDCSEMLERRRDLTMSPYHCMERDYAFSELPAAASSERMVPCTLETSELISPRSVDMSRGNEINEFVKWFRQFHSLLKQLLDELTLCASQLVMKFDEANKAYFSACFRNFQRALTVHTHVEDTYGFVELMKQRPLIFEAYRIDHTTEEEELERIVSLSSNMQIENVGELFLRVSSFASLLGQHMDKEEKHLLPCAIQLLSKTQLKRVVTKMNEESQCIEGWKNFSSIP